MNKSTLLTLSLLFLLLPVFSFHGSTAVSTSTDPVILGSGIKGGQDSNGNYFMESDHLLVKFDGNNPHVSFFLKNNDTPTMTYYKIMYASLNETMPNGTLVNNYRLEQAFWEASPVLQYTEDNTTVIYVNFTTTLSLRSGYGNFIQVPMTIETFMYETSKTVLVGNESVTIPAGAFKYNILLGAWPFADENNTLSLGIRMISNMDAAFYRNNQTGEVNATTTDGVQLSMENPDVALLDGTEVYINSNLVKYGGITFITYEFPYYEHDLYYDPIVNLQSGSTDGTGTHGDGNSNTSDNADIELDGTNIKVLFEGTTPHVKFFIKDADTNFTTYYKLVFASLNETSASGNLVKFQRLETALWTTTGVTTTTVGEANVLEISFTTTLRVISPPTTFTDVPITIHAYLYLGSTQLTYANTTMNVASGSFKYTVEIGAWPFASQDNTLSLAVQILSNVKARLNFNSANHSLTGETDDGVLLKMDNPKIAVVDGVATQIKMTMETSGARTFITYEFPYFTESLVYDPIITLGFTSSSDGEDTTESSLFLLGWDATALFFTGLTSFLIALPLIRKRKHL